MESLVIVSSSLHSTSKPYIHMEDLKVNTAFGVLKERRKYLMPSSIYYPTSVSTEGDRIVI